MEGHNESNSFEEIHKKIQVIESIPTGVHPKSEVILVFLGEKLAAEMYIPNKDDAEKVVEDLKSIGLFAEIMDKSRDNHDPQSAEVGVARTQEVLDELKHTLSNRDHRRYGELMSYPSTAIDAYLGEGGVEKLSNEEEDEMIKDLPGVMGIFRFSKDNKDAELAEVKRKIKLLAEYAPELFFQISKKNAERWIEEALKF